MTPVELSADVAVIGGGLGGIAAALAAADAGRSVILTAEESMIGGQVSSQLTSPLDEHPLVESTGVTASYRSFRDLVRESSGGTANPGEGWVSRVCFEPLVGLQVLQGMLQEHVDSGRIQIRLQHTPVKSEQSGSRIEAVSLQTIDGALLRVTAAVYIDATDLGDLLPLTDTRWIIGSEGSDAYGEPDAVPGRPDRGAEQSFTWVAAVVREAQPLPLGEAPEGYDQMRDWQPFSLDLDGWDGQIHRYRFFRDGPDGKPPFWEYRRIRTAASGKPEAAIINWAGNDYRRRGLVADPVRAKQEARDLTLAFVHWLRTEVPRDPEDGPGPLGGSCGYPELRLAPEISGTPDGLAETPYVRESRRLANPQPVTWHDLRPGPDGFAPSIPDSVGIAWYHTDLHPRVGYTATVFSETAPFQIPASALVPVAGVGPENLVMGAKNLAATQVAAAAYRLQPGEWAIGEAAGIIASVSIGTGATPRRVVETVNLLEEVRIRLTARGAPLAWPEGALNSINTESTVTEKHHV
ncbi:FAD-dependent oxidoreductase [Arthrobacter sp. H5]|uniref:FAD-dependent oxidoreductase n=1 Tax=Arthrobacter sp. H5 TaxID=1267973 RepID=UPI0004B2D406|nr:FAD-dependent oxidoreductase [Arthrobacter sp. H5]